jgi:hypothetical protein
MAWFRPALCCEGDPNYGQPKAEPRQQSAEIVADGGQDGVDGIAGLVLRDSCGPWLDLAWLMSGSICRSAPHLAFDCVAHPPLTPGGVGLEAMLFRRIVALVTGIAKDAPKRDTICCSISGMTVPSV